MEAWGRGAWGVGGGVKLPRPVGSGVGGGGGCPGHDILPPPLPV